MYYGKPASELQTGVTITGSDFTGTLHYVENYTGFSSDTGMNFGNFLAVTFDAPDDVTLSVTLNKANTTQGPVVLEKGDRDCVFRITDKEQQSITVKVEKDGMSNEETYGFSKLTLEPKSELEL